MDIKAFKMDGLGNDFVIIDQRNQNYNLTKDQIIKICDRNFIGCDQLIFIQKSDKKDAELVFYNSDGSVSGACNIVFIIIWCFTKSSIALHSTPVTSVRASLVDRRLHSRSCDIKRVADSARLYAKSFQC